MIMRVWLMAGFILISLSAKADSGVHAYRDFWYPMYHGERLDYCAEDDSSCGKRTANAYCLAMGYAHVRKEKIDYNVGRTNNLEGHGQCTGWQCNGFMVISCEEPLTTTPEPSYRYRSKVFSSPRMDNNRVDWCYKQGHACGEPAAYSFCRRMGYSKTTVYQKDPSIWASKALGDNALCYGKACHGFKSITCYR